MLDCTPTLAVRLLIQKRLDHVDLALKYGLVVS